MPPPERPRGHTDASNLDRRLLRDSDMPTFIRAVVLLAVVAGLVANPTSVRAQSPAPTEEPPPRETAIGLDAGVASVVGFLGITLVRALGEHAQIELGTGIGFSGYQFSVMPKIVVGSPRSHFLAGVGLSVADPTNPLHTTGHPVWLNVDALGYEVVSNHGFGVLVALGITKGLGGGTICTSIDGCEPDERLTDVATQWSPQFRVGYRYWF